MLLLYGYSVKRVKFMKIDNHLQVCQVGEWHKLEGGHRLGRALAVGFMVMEWRAVCARIERVFQINRRNVSQAEHTDLFPEGTKMAVRKAKPQRPGPTGVVRHAPASHAR